VIAGDDCDRVRQGVRCSKKSPAEAGLRQGV
jgi:hypothetical protein